MRAFMEQIAILHHLGIRVVLVHGGGPQLDEVTAKMGVQMVDAIIRHSIGETLPPQMLIPTSLYRKADADKDPELK